MRLVLRGEHELACTAPNELAQVDGDAWTVLRELRRTPLRSAALRTERPNRRGPQHTAIPPLAMETHGRFVVETVSHVDSSHGSSRKRLQGANQGAQLRQLERTFPVVGVSFVTKGSIRPAVGICVDCGDVDGPWGSRKGTQGWVCEHCLDCPRGWVCAKLAHSFRYGSLGYARLDALLAYDRIDSRWVRLRAHGSQYRPERTPTGAVRRFRSLKRAVAS